MINVIRKNQQALMIIITVLVIISFVFFYNISNRNSGRNTPDRVGTIYNRPLSQLEFNKGRTRMEVALQLGLMDMVQVLIQPQGNDRNQASVLFSINSIILRHEADQLLVNPTEEEIKNAESKLRVFQTDGRIDENKLNAFVDKILPSLGFSSGSVIDELVADDLRLQKLRALIGSPVKISASEVRSVYQQRFQKMQVSLIRFSLADVLGEVTVKDEDVKKAFDGKKDGFKSDEKRKISFVTFTLSDEESKLKDAPRMDALQKLANQVNNFFQAAAVKTAKFGDVASKFGVTVTETGAFTEISPDPLLEKIVGASESAFKLTLNNPNEVLQAGNTFYILHLDEVLPSRVLSFEEAKPKILEQLKNDRARESTSVKAGIMRGVFSAALKEGKTLDEIVKGTNFKAESIPPFSLSEMSRETPTETLQIMEKAMSMTDGQLSDFIPSADGGFLLYFEKHLPLDETKYEEEKAKVSQELLMNKQTLALLEWIRIRRDAAKLQFSQR